MSFLKTSKLNCAELFESAHLSHDLGRKSVRGGIATLSAQGISFALNLLRTIILARLLTPADFGIIGMVMVVVGFASMFKDAGLSMATVQKDEINEGQISTLFWCNIVLSVFLGVCVALSSPAVAWFYDQPALTAVTATLAISFLFSGMTIQHQALLRRHMMFKQLAYIQIMSQIIAIIVAVWMAWQGWSYWALVGSAIAQALANMVLVFLYCPWVPKRPVKGTGVRDMFKFGGHLTLASFMGYVSNNIDKALLGRYAGTIVLGYYTRAISILIIPITQINQPISSVLIPTLSRLQNNAEQFRKYYRFCNKAITMLGYPWIIFMLLEVKEIIPLLLGSQWLAVIPIFRVLCVSAFFLLTNSMSTGVVFISLGNTKRMVFANFISSSIRITLFLIGMRWGVIGLAWAFSLSVLISRPIIISICFHKTFMSMMDFFTPVIQSSLLALCITCVYLLISFVFKDIFGLEIMIGLKFLFFVISFVLVILSSRDGRKMIMYLKLLKGN